jgi:hypothetical protein
MTEEYKDGLIAEVDQRLEELLGASGVKSADQLPWASGSVVIEV